MKKLCFLLFIAAASLSFRIFDTIAFDLSASNLTQNWTTIGSITANDDWSGISSIQGFRGDGLAGATGVDPQTILVADDPGVIDINANQTNPNTFATGGVTEFHITDPVVALSGSGTARAPYIKIYLNTSSRTNITVQYNLRDIDGSTDNAVQPVALQYRVGNTGTFTNIAAAFVADATSGPSLATLVTPVSATLPAGCNNQALVELRIMTTDAVGNDEWVGIDDINISSDANIPAPTTTSISPNSAIAGDPGFTLTVNGTDFINTLSTVTWNGVDRTTTFVSATQLTATIPATDISAAGTALVGVTTTGAPASSNTQSFTIIAPGVPTLTLTTPLPSFGNICINTTTGTNSFY
ncbi:MAG: IPT/TIG domain-containing protein [Bacteroidota bacterium]